MINTIISNAKTIDTNKKIHNITCICDCCDEKHSPQKSKDVNLYQSRKEKYNNHIYYSNFENNRNNQVHHISENYNNLSKFSRINSNSKSKKKEEAVKHLNLLDIKKNNNNKYQNINNICHSHENKKDNKYNLKNNKINNYNLKHIKTNYDEMNIPELNKGKEYIMYNNTNINKNNLQNNNNIDLSKTLQYFKKRNNYGYKEIKDIKKNNNNKNQNIINNNNNKDIHNKYNYGKKEKSDENYIFNNKNQENQNITNIRNSLNLINNKNINKIYYNNDKKYNNNISYKITLTKKSIKNFPTVDIHEEKKDFHHGEKNDFIKNNCSSYRNINNYKRRNEKENKENINLIKNYFANTPGEKNKIEKKPLVNYTKRNENNKIKSNYLHSNDTDKENINTSRYNSSEFKETSTDIKTIKYQNKDNNYTKNVIYPKYLKIKQKNETISQIKKDFLKVFNHEKQKSFNNNIPNGENIYTSTNEQINTSKDYKNIKNVNYKISDNYNKTSKRLENQNNVKITNKREQKQSDNNLRYKYTRYNDKNANISNIIKTEYKEPHKKLSTNECEMKESFYKDRFKIKDLNKKIKNTNSKEKKNPKEIIRKQYKSLEKKDEKENISKRLFHKSNRIKTKTKTKSKSKAKKHSKCIKYLDNLKIYKFSETGYNINNDSSTANTKNNNEESKYRKYILKTIRSSSKKKKNINSFNLQYKTFEEDYKIKNIKIKEQCKYLKPQISCRITLSKKNNVHIVGILRYFKVNYYYSENLRCEYDADSEDTSEYYNNKF